MDIFYNNVNSLPQQVEENRENIELLFGMAAVDNISRTNELLLSSAWQQEGDKYTIEIVEPYMTEYSLVYIAFNDSPDKLDEFRKIYMVEGLTEKFKLYALEKPNVNITVTVWYTNKEETW